MQCMNYIVATQLQMMYAVMYGKAMSNYDQVLQLREYGLTILMILMTECMGYRDLIVTMVYYSNVYTI